MTIIIAASGPSLTREQADMCAGHDVMTVNNACRLFTGNRYHYAADYDWWAAYRHEVTARTSFTNAPRAVREFGVRPAGMRLDGSNSGSHALQLAHQLGHRRIVLIGFDFQHTDGRRHFFGSHPAGMRDAAGVAIWLSRLPAVLRRLRGCEILNATPTTAIPAELIPRVTLQEALNGTPKHMHP